VVDGSSKVAASPSYCRRWNPFPEVEGESGEASPAEPVGQMRIALVIGVRRFAGRYAVADAEGRGSGGTLRQTQLPDDGYAIGFPVDRSYFHHLGAELSTHLNRTCQAVAGNYAYDHTVPHHWYPLQPMLFHLLR
jgi:hypothetical protein